MKRIYIIVGSVRPHWLGKRIAQWVRVNAKNQANTTYTIVNAEDIALGTAEDNELINKRTYDLANADGYILVAPEYESNKHSTINRVLSALKQEVSNKPVAFVAYGLNGGYKLVDSLRSRVRKVNKQPLRNAVHIEQPWEVIDQSGELHDKEHEQHLKLMLKQLSQLIALQKPAVSTR